MDDGELFPNYQLKKEFFPGILNPFQYMSNGGGGKCGCFFLPKEMHVYRIIFG